MSFNKMRIILALGGLHGFTQFCLIQVDWLQKTAVLATLTLNHFLQFPFFTLSLPPSVPPAFIYLFFPSFPHFTFSVPSFYPLLSFVRSFLLSFPSSVYSCFCLLFLPMLLFFLSSSIFPICFPHLLFFFGLLLIRRILTVIYFRTIA